MSGKKVTVTFLPFANGDALCISDVTLPVNLQFDFNIAQTSLFHLPQEYLECDELKCYFISFASMVGRNCKLQKCV